MADRKKSFVQDNPALQFISSADPDPAAPAPRANRPETRSRRLQVVLPPSLYERVRGRAERDGLSVNEFVNRALDGALREG